MAADPLKIRLREFIRQHDLLEEDQRLVLGVSGGVDSVVLMHLLGEDFHPLVVHVDHGLRADSGEDADFVVRQAKALELEARVECIEVPPGASRQAQARRARYDVLERVAAEEGIDTVVVAHHRDDVAETLLLQLVRGAGPRGWRAMPVSRPIRRRSAISLVRPLRFAERAEIEAYARAHGIEWREDPSNSALGYRRAVIRTQVIPLLKEHFGEGVVDRLASAAELAEAYIESGAALGSEDALEEAQVEPGALSIETLLGMDAVVRRGVILEVLARDYPNAPRSAVGVAEIERLLDAQPGRRVEVGTVAVWREREVLRFTETHQPVQFVGNVGVPGRLDTPWGSLTTEPLDYVPEVSQDDDHIEVIDAESVGETLMVRTRQEGDRFVPLGMEGSKKVSDLLTERRVPSSERDHQLVLTADEEIVWVVGHRLGNAFRVRSGSRRTVRLEWRPH